MAEQRSKQNKRRQLTQSTHADTMRFVEYDTNGDCQLDFEEFHAAMPRKIREQFAASDIRTWFDAADLDSSGSLSVNEFFRWSLGNAAQKYGSGALQTAFKRYDQDGTGQLDETEFTDACIEMGYGGVAHEIFKALDDDGSGTVSYHELVATLMGSTPNNDDTKKMLTALMWSYDESTKTDPVGGIDTSNWVIHGRDATSVAAELRALLDKSGAQISDLCKVFDDDADTALQIDSVEFHKGMRTRCGFKGQTYVLDQVFKMMDEDGGGCIGFDELYEFVRGKRHSLDPRNNKLDMTLIPPPGAKSLYDVVWSAPAFRLLLQQMLTRCKSSPAQLYGEWDVSRRGIREPDFIALVRNQIFKEEMSDLFQAEVKPVLCEAFKLILATVKGSNLLKRMSVVHFERWFDPRYQSDFIEIVPLKNRRQLRRQQTHYRDLHLVAAEPLPKVNTVRRAKEDIKAVARAAAQRSMMAEAALEEKRHQWELWRKGQSTLPPVQRWETPQALKAVAASLPQVNLLASSKSEGHLPRLKPRPPQPALPPVVSPTKAMTAGTRASTGTGTRTSPSTSASWSTTVTSPNAIPQLRFSLSSNTAFVFPSSPSPRPDDEFAASYFGPTRPRTPLYAALDAAAGDWLL